MDEAQMGEFVHMLTQKYGMSLEAAIQVARNMSPGAGQPAPQAPAPQVGPSDAELDKWIQDTLATPQTNRKAGPPTLDQAEQEAEPASPMAARIAAVRRARSAKRPETDSDYHIADVAKSPTTNYVYIKPNKPDGY